MHGVSLHVLFFFCHFCLLLLVFFLRDVLGSTVAMRGGNLKKKRLEGGWGEGAAPPPQMLWVSLHVLFFFCHFCLLLVFFSS